MMQGASRHDRALDSARPRSDDETRLCEEDSNEDIAVRVVLTGAL